MVWLCYSLLKVETCLAFDLRLMTTYVELDLTVDVLLNLDGCFVICYDRFELLLSLVGVYG